MLIEQAVVPDVFLRVLHAKRLRSKGKAKNLSEACKIAGLSRTAFYKYHDRVFVYEEKNRQKTITIYLRLNDDLGVLSAVLFFMSQQGANVLTVNQNLPIDGVADVTITLRLVQSQTSVSTLLNQLAQLAGVVKLQKI